MLEWLANDPEKLLEAGNPERLERLPVVYTLVAGTPLSQRQDPDAAVQPDLPPYPLSDAYGVRVVPTLFLVGTDGTVLHLVESWDRDGYNEAARRLAELTGRPSVTVSHSTDGLPPFRPG